LALEAEDIFINVAGGIKIEDPAADLAVCAVIASSFRDQVVLPKAVVLGEVGLSGEIRSISSVLTRINEAEKLGFKHCILPKNSIKNLKFKKSEMEIIAVSTLKEALDIILGSAIKPHSEVRE